MLDSFVTFYWGFPKRLSLDQKVLVLKLLIGS